MELTMITVREDRPIKDILDARALNPVLVKENFKKAGSK